MIKMTQFKNQMNENILSYVHKNLNSSTPRKLKNYLSLRWLPMPLSSCSGSSMKARIIISWINLYPLLASYQHPCSLLYLLLIRATLMLVLLKLSKVLWWLRINSRLLFFLLKITKKLKFLISYLLEKVKNKNYVKALGLRVLKLNMTVCLIHGVLLLMENWVLVIPFIKTMNKIYSIIFILMLHKIMKASLMTNLNNNHKHQMIII